MSATGISAPFRNQTVVAKVGICGGDRLAHSVAPTTTFVALLLAASTTMARRLLALTPIGMTRVFMRARSWSNESNELRDGYD